MVLFLAGQGREVRSTLPGRPIRPVAIERFSRFAQLLDQHRGDRAAARRALAPEFANTYWFYYVFRGPGAGHQEASS